MDISGDGSAGHPRQRIGFGTPMLGETYSIYAHVSAHEEGRYMYNATYYRAQSHCIYGSVHRISPARRARRRKQKP